MEEFVLKVAGKPFRCECGCNVFHKQKPVEEPEMYKCNCCDTYYYGGDNPLPKGYSETKNYTYTFVIQTNTDRSRSEILNELELSGYKILDPDIDECEQ